MPYSPTKTLSLVDEARKREFPPGNGGVVHEGFHDFIHSDKQIAAYLVMEAGIPGVVRHFVREKLKEYINGEFYGIETPDQTFTEK